MSLCGLLQSIKMWCLVLLNVNLLKTFFGENCQIIKLWECWQIFYHFIGTKKLENAFFFISSRAVLILMFKHTILENILTVNIILKILRTLTISVLGSLVSSWQNRSWKNKEIFLFSECFICNSLETAQKDRYSFLKGCWFSTFQLIKVGISHWLSGEICISYFRFT